MHTERGKEGAFEQPVTSVSLYGQVSYNIIHYHPHL